MHHFCQWRWKDTRADSGAAEDVSRCIPGSIGVGPVEILLVGASAWGGVKGKTEELVIQRIYN